MALVVSIDLGRPRGGALSAPSPPPFAIATPRLLAQSAAAPLSPAAMAGLAESEGAGLDLLPQGSRQVLPLRPGDVICDRGHRREAGQTHGDLHHHQIGTGDQDEMAGEGQEYADAEHREPFLAASDDRP